jgi:non-specific serine/threonine protein kinase
MVTVCCFGEFEVRGTKEALTHQQERLLAYLCSGDEPRLHRDVAQFFGRNYRPLITKLNSRLSDERIFKTVTLSPAGKGRRARALQLVPDKAEVDSVRFDQAVADANDPRVNYASRIEHLIAAAKQVRGPFLNGWNDTWVVDERRRKYEPFCAASKELLDRIDTFAGRSVVARALLHMIRTSEGPLCKLACQMFRQLATRMLDDGRVATVRRLCNDVLTGLGRSSSAWRQLDSFVPEVEHAETISMLGKMDLPETTMFFRGRTNDVRLVLDALTQSPVVTLTGTGGIGKTTLGLIVAKEAVRDFRGGVVYVDLKHVEPEDDLSSLVAATSKALGLVTKLTPMGKLDTAAMRKQLIEHFKTADGIRTLMVLDQCEHLASECSNLLESDLLPLSADLRILVTSRQPLTLAENHQRVVALAPLQTPSIDEQTDPKAFKDSPSVSLFHSLAPQFGKTEYVPTIAKISVLTRGFPLVIKQAAAWAAVEAHCKGAKAALDCVATRLTDISSLADDDHIAGVVEISFRRLDPVAQRLVLAVSAFPGGCSRDSLESVVNQLTLDTDKPFTRPEIKAGLDGAILSSLLAQAALPPHSERFDMVDINRSYGLRILKERGLLHAAHRSVAVEMKNLCNASSREIVTAAQPTVMATMASETENIRWSLQWCMDQDVGLGLEICTAMLGVWTINGEFPDGRTRLIGFLQAANLQVCPAEKGRAWIALGALAFFGSDYKAASKFCDDGLKLLDNDNWYQCVGLLVNGVATFHAIDRRSGLELLDDARRVSLAGNDAWIQSLVICTWAAHHAMAGSQNPTSDAQYQESLEALRLARRTENPWLLSVALSNHGLLLLTRTDVSRDELKDTDLQALRIRVAFHDKYGIIQSVGQVAVVAATFLDNEETLRLAAKLFWAQDQLIKLWRNRIEIPLQDRKWLGESKRKLRVRLGAAYDECEREGRRLTLEQLTSIRF